MEQKENVMGTRPVMPLLLSMAFPPMLSMLIQSMYNVVDSIFVARLSEDALTAVSLVYPLQNLSLAVSVGLGVGLNSCVARSLGEGNRQKAEEAISHGFILAAVHGLIFVLAGLFLSRPFLSMFTDDPQILDMAVTYSVIVITFTFGSHFHIAIEKIFQATGNMIVPMVLQGVGAVINIILDPILIFGMFGLHDHRTDGGVPAGVRAAAEAERRAEAGIQEISGARRCDWKYLSGGCALHDDDGDAVPARKRSERYSEHDGKRGDGYRGAWAVF